MQSIIRMFVQKWSFQQGEFDGKAAVTESCTPKEHVETQVGLMILRIGKETNQAVLAFQNHGSPWTKQND